MTNINIKELMTRLADRTWYIEQGYPADVAEQYSFDHMYAGRKVVSDE